jgi:enoyl-CoA hydratase/carnithine racemase
MRDAAPGSPLTRIRRETAGGAIEIITLDRPDQRNALSEFILKSLLLALDQLKKDPAIRAIVIAANGPAFCAGHDLKELTAHRTDADKGAAFFREIMGLCAQVMQAVALSPKPVIAAVEGVATAAGCQLVASCDLAVASQTAQFCTPGVNIGLFCSTPMVALSRNISRKRAMEMLLLGEMLNADDALNFGLVNRVVPAGQALDGALRFATAIAAKSPVTVKIGKEAFQRQLDLPLGDAYTYTAEVMVQNMLAADAEEGIGAVIEKRPPVWGPS